MNSQLDEFCTLTVRDEKLAYNLQLILEELFVNFVKHGGNDDGEFKVSITPQDQELWVEVHDNGNAFDPLAQDVAQTDIQLEERTEGGLGLHFMKTLSTQATYQRVDSWNVLKMCLMTPKDERPEE